MTNALVQAEPLAQALALAEQAGDVAALKDIRAMATALQNGARARGMGIDQENKAAEVVLRAERGIGKTLISLRDAGRYDVDGVRHDAKDVFIVARYVQSHPGESYRTIAEATGIGRQVVANKLSQYDFFVNEGGRWSLDEGVYNEWVEWRESVVKLADFGLNSSSAQNFQRLAALEDAQFDALLREAAESGRRIAKVNFYTAAQGPKARSEREAPETPLNNDWETFRRGAFALLGWTVDPDGTEGPTTNGLIGLPADTLRQAAQIIKALAAAYNEVRNAR